MMKRFALLALCGAATLAVDVHGAPPHVHGVAALDVSLDGETLQLGLDSPLDNLVGFEHPPANAKEVQADRATRQLFTRGDTLFVPSAEARCKVKSVQLKDHREEGHADLDADITFRCERPQDLKRLEVKLFDAFPGMRQIDAQIATPRRQSAARLTAKNNVIAF